MIVFYGFLLCSIFSQSLPLIVENTHYKTMLETHPPVLFVMVKNCLYRFKSFNLPSSPLYFWCFIPWVKYSLIFIFKISAWHLASHPPHLPQKQPFGGELPFFLWKLYFLGGNGQNKLDYFILSVIDHVCNPPPRTPD